MLPEKDKGRIEGLNEKLNSRTRYHSPVDSREPVSESGDTAPEAWQSTPIDEMLLSERRRAEPYPLIKKIFLVASLFCVCAIIAAVLLYIKGDNFISTKNVDISVEGPVSISAGSPVELHVTVKNGNNGTLSNVHLNITYPNGTRNADNPTQELLHTKEVIDVLGSGEKMVKPERAIFLGAEGDVKEVRITVDYKVGGSNATFTKEKLFELTIGSAPVSLTVSHPDTVTSGKPFTATVSVVANSEEPLKNIILRAEYPYGWTQSGSSPAPTGSDKNVWVLGDLSPGGKKVVSLSGTLIGEDNEERTFRFFVGSGSGGGSTFDTSLSSDSVVIAINRPSLDLGVKLNGDSSAVYSAPAGQPIHMVIDFKNNLSSNLISPQIEVKLSGASLDRNKVDPGSIGFYDSNQSRVVWNQSNDSDLSNLAPGKEGSVSLNLASISAPTAGSNNQKIDLVVTLSGLEQGKSQVSVSESRTVKIASEVSLSSKSLYSRGPFTNIGPIPPRAETGTTYTIELDLGNTQNDVGGSRVTGTLGANVTWLGEISPKDDAITYDATTKTVTWDAGTLASGAGFSSPARQAFFRVSLTPSLGQVGAVPVLFSNIVFSGTDGFTHLPVKVTNAAVTTRISSDPRYVQGDETVVK
ncbi:hypothetical protein KW800_00645 [Candidatus Parcubacteria bacterium]|nr:hypothetical protein [Candidatus Parcubacteria bacterium]